MIFEEVTMKSDKPDNERPNIVTFEIKFKEGLKLAPLRLKYDLRKNGDHCSETFTFPINKILLEKHCPHFLFCATIPCWHVCSRTDRLHKRSQSDPKCRFEGPGAFK